MDEFKALQQKVIAFRDARDWSQFHDPKNLAEGLSIEAAELMENFLWKTTEQSRQLSDTERARVKDELADIFVFLMVLSHELDIDLFSETHRKIDQNAQKYPVDKAKGNCKKYTDL